MREALAQRPLFDPPAGEFVPVADAVIDGPFRYLLNRQWSAGTADCLWIMLNPSKADALDDDPTLDRCIAFSKRWGANGLTVVNLFALRSTDPARLMSAPDPVGPWCDLWIERAIKNATTVIVAWGAHPMATRERVSQVLGSWKRPAVIRNASDSLWTARPNTRWPEVFTACPMTRSRRTGGCLERLRFHARGIRRQPARVPLRYRALAR